MLKNIVIILFCVFAYTKCEDEAAVDPEMDKAVYILTTKNFNSFIEEHPYVLVKFYAPWCGHCKALAPKYEAAAESLKGQKFGDKEVALAKVDATVETELATRFEIQGYPTLKWFHNGQAMEYDAGREESDLIDFIKQHADPNWQPPKSVVITLGGSNFTEFIESEEISLVEFYAPWCGHCKRLAPDYEKAARKLKERKTGSPILLAKVDATAEENKDIVAKYEVKGYPTLKIFRKGRLFDFKSKGQPDEHSIVSYMERQALPASRVMSDSKSFKKAIDSADDDVVVVGFFESETEPFYQTYIDAANELRDEDFKLIHVIGRDQWKEHEITKPTIAVYIPARFQTKHEPKRHEFTNKEVMHRSEIVDFVRAHSLPLVGHFNQMTQEKRYNSRRPLCLFFYSVDFSHAYRETTQMWRKKIANIAKDYKDITFAVANDEEQNSVMKELGLEDSSEEMNVGCWDAKSNKFNLDPPMEEFSDKLIRNFLNKMKKGELKPFYKSQAVPQKGREMDGHVNVVVGKTFEDIVMKSDKDVLVFLYAPWCGHCKNFAPEYKKLADQVIPKEKDRLILAKIDATANDVPSGYTASGFPTLYFAPAGRKDTPIQYEGNRQIDDIITFMKKHAAKAFIAAKKTVDEL